MKKLFALCLFSTILSMPVLANIKVDGVAAVNSFKSGLSDIHRNLQNGKLSLSKAQILLSAIQARQNQILIVQNEEILQLLKQEGNK